jgi:hypothetical protein
MGIADTAKRTRDPELVLRYNFVLRLLLEASSNWRASRLTRLPPLRGASEM